MNPKIFQVETADDYKLRLIFTKGERGIYDCSSLLNFGVFKALEDENYFKQIKVSDGTVVWAHEQEFALTSFILIQPKALPKHMLKRDLLLNPSVSL